MEEALVSRLAAAATPAGDSVSWGGRVRGDPLPSIALSTVTPGEEWTHEGPDGLDRPRVRFDIYARRGREALATARAVTAEMHLSRTVDGVLFHPAMKDAERMLGDEEQEGGKPLFRIQLEFLFYHEETD